MRRALDVDDVVALLVTDVVLLGDPEHLLAQQEDVAVEQGVRLDLHRHTGAGHPILAPALRAFDELPGEFILQLVRRSTLTSHAYRHGRLQTVPDDERSGGGEAYRLATNAARFAAP